MRNDLMLVVGTPEEVIRRITIAMRALRPGMLFLLAPQGDVAHSDRRRNIRLLGEHVLPELRKEADRLGLPSMFERPLRSVPLEPGAARKPVIDLSVLEELSVIPA